ncbi:TPA: hypothetical protein ACKP9T_001581 [Pseudomonas aeruginosa]|uniref:hypothetical protein n=1 Tax=Pseudomonas aeruginosa TaxID=287 RepID=UPI00106A092F|nr:MULTISPECIES: hypothetical protein [Pseudomonas]EKV4052209.1 hypothetical protein [Pseudomonas aeruginosa]MBG5021816.1 hypothetical protein [Pseudomonas aeruginosa]MBG6785872.1 hypothetical protein [Pseudomonas aeruginosa]MBH9215336.1 hypothetical protein [Pseudomonas aeruginosa]MBH9375971.1 hypothetical protein [Pseudomonas aeruginosa]
MTFNRTATTKVINVLALAMLLAWVGHTFALLAGTGADYPAGVNSEVGHGHSHDASPITACMLCVDHQHPPMTADHVHETPYLVALLDLHVPFQGERSLSASWQQLPEKLIYLIERPPRSGFVL